MKTELNDPELKRWVIDLSGLNHFLRLATGGWDCLPVNLQEQRDYIFPIIRELDPTEKYWHIDGDIIWKVDPWKESQVKMRELHAKRELEQIELDKRKKVKDDLVAAIQFKFNLADKQTAEMMALEFIRRGAESVIEFFGIDISCLSEEENKPHIVLENGKKIDEY